MNKPSLRDRRRTEAREALYRAQERREQLIASLVRNANSITTLKRRLKHLDAPVGNAISPLPLSVAKGELLPEFKEINVPWYEDPASGWERR